MIDRKLKMKIKLDTIEFDMGELWAEGHIPRHYNKTLLKKDKKLIAELLEKNIGKVISRGREKKAEETIEE